MVTLRKSENAHMYYSHNDGKFRSDRCKELKSEMHQPLGCMLELRPPEVCQRLKVELCVDWGDVILQYIKMDRRLGTQNMKPEKAPICILCMEGTSKCPKN